LRCANMAQQKQAPRWLWLLLGVGILVYLGFIVLPMIYCHYNGKEAVAIITNTSIKMEGGVGMDPPYQAKYYTLSFDGHSVQRRTSGKRQIGDRLAVIYLTNNPDSVVRGSRADGLWRTIENSTNERNLAIGIGIAVFLLCCAAKTPALKKHNEGISSLTSRCS
jgi:hypothetical protein